MRSGRCDGSVLGKAPLHPGRPRLSTSAPGVVLGCPRRWLQARGPARGTFCLRGFAAGKRNGWLVPEPSLSFSREGKASR